MNPQLTTFRMKKLSCATIYIRIQRHSTRWLFGATFHCPEQLISWNNYEYYYVNVVNISIIRSVLVICCKCCLKWTINDNKVTKLQFESILLWYNVQCIVQRCNANHSIWMTVCQSCWWMFFQTSWSFNDYSAQFHVFFQNYFDLNSSAIDSSLPTKRFRSTLLQN